MAESEKTGFWAIVEIMGHKRYAGYVSEEVLGGASFIRVDVPAGDDLAAYSKLFGSQVIYCITPVSEDAARLTASTLKEIPLTEWDLPQEWRQAISRQQFELSVERNDSD